MARRAVGRHVHAASTKQSGFSKQVEAIVKQYLPLINKFAFKFGIGTDLPRDLVNTGVIALLEAHRRFIPSKSVRFGTYAYEYIRGAMLNYIRTERFHGGIGHDMPEFVSFERFVAETNSTGTDSPSDRHDVIGDLSSEIALIETIDRERKVLILEAALARLTSSERTVIRLLFFEDGTQRRAAARLGVSEPRVSALVRTSLRKLRNIVA
jgi:RNA polymerase sigma factor (sigma-70 family)